MPCYTIRNVSSDDLTKQTPTPDRLDELISLVHNVVARLGALEQRLDNLEQKVDERLHDTRPIWEAVQNQIAELRKEMTKGFQRIDRKLDLFNEELIDL